MAAQPLRFKCLSCGGTVFSVSGELKTYEDFVGASCVACGHNITDEEIKWQATDIALERLMEAINRRKG
jgi:transcription elongation factor Elf1